MNHWPGGAINYGKEIKDGQFCVMCEIYPWGTLRDGIGTCSILSKCASKIMYVCTHTPAHMCNNAVKLSSNDILLKTCVWDVIISK